MALIRSTPQSPLRWSPLLLAMAGLWIAPVLVGLFGLAMFLLIGKTYGEMGLGIWFFANALTFSPLFSWVGWLIALPMLALALRWGWFGWAPAAGLGALAGAMAGAIADTDIALPFGIVAVLALRLVLGRVLVL